MAEGVVLKTNLLNCRWNYWKAGLVLRSQTLSTFSQDAQFENRTMVTGPRSGPLEALGFGSAPTITHRW